MQLRASAAVALGDTVSTGSTAAAVAGSADAMRSGLEEVVARIDGEIEGLRSLIRELRPAALDELGPVPAIEELASRMSARHGLEVSTSLGFQGRRPAEVETTLYRIIQEALTNAVKHAGAAHVAIEVEESDGALRLSRSPTTGRASIRGPPAPASGSPACASGSP
jgi:signal transduction histidine kinase